MPAEPRRYERAVANAQEAHEAIRPAGDVFRTPDELARELSRDELALYDLDLQADDRVADEGRARPDGLDRARGATTADEPTPSSARRGTVITFPGFLLAYESGRDEPAEDDEERRLPALTVGQDAHGVARSSRRATRRARRRATPRRAS